MNNIIEKLTLLSCFDTIIDVQGITEGNSHCCYKVITQNGNYFAKYFESERETRLNEHNITVYAAKYKLTPQVFYLSEHWLVTYYIEEMANIDELDLTEKIVKTAQLMAKCHQLQFDLPSLELNSVVDKLLIDNRLSKRQHLCLKKVLKNLPKITVERPLVVCHGDVNFSNVIFGESTYLIDFECAAKADAEYDLAMMAAINLLNKNQQSVLLTTYQKNSLITLCKDTFLSYLPYCYLINGLWYLLRSLDDTHSKCYQLAQKQFTTFDSLTRYKEVQLSVEMR